MPDLRDNQASGAEGGSPRYRILERIGAGGMGEVYLSRDVMLDRRVALKFLPEPLAADATARQRFLLEAKAAAALDHPYICKIYELGELDGRSFIAMEFVEGQTLEKRIADGPPGTPEAVRLATEIVEALETAHAAGIVHRDLKPANVMITASGHVKVMDFGLAKRVDAATVAETRIETAARLTASGAIMGTPAYMSPEQLRGEDLDVRSDTFSLGVVLYEMLTGVHPFAGDAAMDTIAAILGGATPRLARHRDDLPELLEHLVAKMTAKEPGERYQHIREARIDLSRVREALADAAASTPATAPAKGPADHPSRHDAPAPQPLAVGQGATKPRLPGGARLALAALVAVVALAALGTWWIATAPPDPAVLVVVPFHHLGPDPSEDHWGESMSHAVYRLLIQAGVPTVSWDAARSRYQAGEDPHVVAQALDADFALHAAYTFQEDDTFVLTLSLIAADTGIPVWVEELPSSYGNLQELEPDIALLAATKLDVALTEEQRLALATPKTVSADAYELYSQGAFLFRSASHPEDMEGAIRYFEAALEADPKLVDAHIGIGAVRVAQNWEGGGDIEGLHEAQEHYQAALEEDPASMPAYRGLMGLRSYFGGEYAADILRLAEAAARAGHGDDVEALLVKAMAASLGADDAEATHRAVGRALERDAAHEEALYWGLTTQWLVSPTRTEEYAARYFRLAGRDPEGLMWLGFAYLGADQPGAAAERFRQAIDLAQGDAVVLAATIRPEIYIFGGFALERDGRPEEAKSLWRDGVAAVELRIADAPQNPRLHVMAAALHGLLDDEPMMRAHEHAGREEMNTWSLGILAAVHGKRGDTDAALALVENDATPWYFRDFYRLATGTDAGELAEFRELAADLEAREQELRQTYQSAYLVDAGQ